jgi:hypothetical protein
VAALLGPGLVVAFTGINNSKATGLAAVAGGFLESLFSPLFWILALSLFALFFSASRLSTGIVDCWSLRVTERYYVNR